MRQRLISLSSPLLRNALIFFTAVLLVAVTQVLRSGESAQEGSIDIYANIPSIDLLISTYHENANKKVNEYVDEMYTKLDQLAKNESSDEVRLALFTPPEFEKDPKTKQPTGRRLPCTASEKGRNISTYCLSLDLVSEYFAFRKQMIFLRQQEKSEAAQFSLPQEGERRAIPDVMDAYKNLSTYDKNLRRIEDELDISRQALDQTLAAYNELQTALPLHQKYQKVISALEKYRSEVSALRQKVEQFPSAFLNVSTTQCT